MKTQVDVTIVGAGNAGLSALQEVRKVTDNYLLIDAGPPPRSGARLGYISSTVAVHLAELYRTCRPGEDGGVSEEPLRHIRELHESFADLVLADRAETTQRALTRAPVTFLDAHRLRVGKRIVRTRATVIATGSRSYVPPAWQRFGDGVLTVEELFEQNRLPRSVAVVGLGPIGLEIGQALHRLGVQVTGVERQDSIAGIDDPVINRAALDSIGREFPLWLHETPLIERPGKLFRVRAGQRETQVEKLVVAMGRLPNVDALGLERLGVVRDRLGVPVHDAGSLQVGKLPVFIAGDATGMATTLQQALDQGRTAGHNAARRSVRELQPRPRLSVVCCRPRIATVGMAWSQLDQDRVEIGQVLYRSGGYDSRRHRCVLRVYADRYSGQILGAAMIGSGCEEVAHRLAWAVERRMTVAETLGMPSYHTAGEAVLRQALQDIVQRMSDRPGSRFRSEASPGARQPPTPAAPPVQ